AIERVSSHSLQPYSPCVVASGASGDVIRDSVCWYTGTDAVPDTAALKVFTQTSGGGAATVRNVTAVSSGGSAGLQAIRFNGASTGNGTNVVAMSGTGSDVRSLQYPSFSGTQNVILDHSNYDSELEASPGGDITDPGTGTGNQTTAPVFVDATNGDFREQPTSTGTIDLGTPTGLLPGELDFEAQARTQGATPDIGADETAPSAPSG